MPEKKTHDFPSKKRRRAHISEPLSLHPAGFPPPGLVVHVLAPVEVEALQGRQHRQLLQCGGGDLGPKDTEDDLGVGQKSGNPKMGCPAKMGTKTKTCGLG